LKQAYSSHNYDRANKASSTRTLILSNILCYLTFTTQA